MRSEVVLSPHTPVTGLSPRQFNPLSPTTRQTTRALQEIQSLHQTGFTTPGSERWSTNISGNLNISVMSPNPSPDEMVIQARGRRQVPLTFSPDISRSPLRHRIHGIPSPLTSGNTRTPLSSQNSRLMLLPSQTRTSPRKRLTLNDTPPGLGVISSSFYSPSPDKLRISPLAKKLRLDPGAAVTPETAIKAISKKQLENLVEKLLMNHPEMRGELAALIPTPDLSPLEEKLNYLKKNIYKALPNTRLESKTDSLAYNRVSVHLQTFKKSVVEGVRVLADGGQWLSLVDYSIIAWGYVKGTPVWDNPPHNSIRKSCFKYLATSVMKSLKEGCFSRDQCITIRDKLQTLKGDSDEMMVCLKFIDFYLNNDNID